MNQTEAFARFLEAAPDAMLVVDRAGQIVMVNRRAEVLFGYERDALLGQRIEILVPERYRSRHSLHRAAYTHAPAVRPMGAGLDLYGRRKDGGEFPVEISLSPLEVDGDVFIASAIRDISERKKLERERVELVREQAARTEAEAANRAKDEFIAMLAHELRNPLAAISTAIGVLNRIGGQDVTSVNARGVIGRQVTHLSRLVDDLLDVARVSTGKIALHRRPVDVAEVATRCVAALSSTGTNMAHRVSLDVAPVWVDADPIRLEQMIGNLLTNAVKYTPRGGSIRLTARAEGNSAVIVVQDTGLGMTADLVSRVFELFVQGEQAPDRAYGGLGVGLALVKRLVEAHGGTVEAFSEGPARGSTFTIRLPRVPRPAEQPPMGTPCDENVRYRILLIEDNRDSRDMLRTLLELQGHQVYAASDGVAGLETALTVRPDVAFIDIGLPGMDGYQIAQRIKEQGAPHPLLVALTGYGRAADREKAMQAGFDHHLVKPVDDEAIGRILGQVVSVPRR
jgi:PAS domain S-box-containing protein